jgi:YD repeat-containing protein
VDWEVEFLLPEGLEVSNESGSASLVTINAEGKVAQDSFYWDGLTDEDLYVEIDTNLEVRVLAEVPGSGNTWGEAAGLTCPNCKRCRKCEEKDMPHRGEVELQLPLPALPTLPVVLSYLSGQFGQGTASMGYGWSSGASERLTETLAGSLIYKEPGGMVLRWEPDGGDYIPVRADNHVLAEKPGTPAYRLTFRDQSIKEFDSNGRLTADIDRSGNSITYTYSSGDLASQSDSDGRTVYYGYGSRTDGQPVLIAPHSLSDDRKVELEYYPDTDTDAPDRLRKIILPEGETSEFFYYPLGRLKKVVQVRPTLGDLQVEYEYDFYGRLSRQVVNEEVETLYTYSTYLRTATVTDLTSSEEPLPALRTIDLEYDIFNNLIRRTDNFVAVPH